MIGPLTAHALCRRKMHMAETLLDHWRHELGVKAAAFAANDSIAAAEVRPLPTPDQIRAVNSAEKAIPATFLRSGVSDLLAIVETLAEAIATPSPSMRSPFPNRPTVMELGCGLGRLLRHAPDATRAEMIATDVNADSLGWCRANLPDVTYHLHGPLPPIESLAAASVDIIYAHSVFTHIPLERQHAWLRELERVLRPGGWLVATVLGREQQDALLNTEQHDILAAHGAIQIRPRWRPDSKEPWTYGAVCQTVAHQEATMTAVFDIALRRERHNRQAVLALRRRSLTSDRP
jgi:SAM-dependent methyltransferase